MGSADMTTAMFYGPLAATYGWFAARWHLNRIGQFGRIHAACERLCRVSSVGHIWAMHVLALEALEA